MRRLEDNRPLISVITPCHNGELTVGRTIQSVIDQTYTGWELLVVDDGSTDGSAQVIKQFADNDKRIRYLRTPAPSGSPALPRNIGIDNARGEYIAFLDADDLWLPEKLERQVAFAVENGCGFVYADYEKMNHRGERNNRVVRCPESIGFWDMLETCALGCLTVMIGREVIGDTRFKAIPKEDYAFWLDILKKGTRACNAGGVLALYREQPGSRSGNKWDMVRKQWYVLRNIEGVKRVVAAYFLTTYLLHGFFKFLK